MNHWSSIKETVTNVPSIIWTFLYNFFSKKHCHQKYSFFSRKYFCRFFSFTWVSLPESWRFKEACCISSHFLRFLYFEKPIFEFNFSNYCLIFFIISWFLSLLKCSSKRIFCFNIANGYFCLFKSNFVPFNHLNCLIVLKDAKIQSFDLLFTILLYFLYVLISH